MDRVEEGRGLLVHATVTFYTRRWLCIVHLVTLDCLWGLTKAKGIHSAVYTGIKKPESFSHSGFLLKVARQLPLNTPKTHLRSVIFWNSAEISLFFWQCKRSLQSRRYYSGFWSRGTWPSAESPDHGLRCNAHYTCTVKGREKSRMRTTYQNTSMRFWGFFAHALFVPKTPNVMGFSGSVNGTTKNPGFLDFGFCQCKWASWLNLSSQSHAVLLNSQSSWRTAYLTKPQLAYQI